MSKFENITRTVAALAAAIVVSTTMVFGTVAPAQAGAPTQIARAIA